MGFSLNRQCFLGFNRLVLAIAPATAGHHTAGELINDHRFAIANDVVDVLDEQILGLEGIGDVVGPGVLGIKQILHPQHLLSLGEALISEGAAALLLVDLVVTFGSIPSFPISAARVSACATWAACWYFSWGRCTWPEMIKGVRLHRSGSSQPRRSRSTETHVERLHDVCGHVVPQIVEAQLGVGGVGDVAVVVAAPFLRTHVLLDQANRKAEKRCTCPIHSASRRAR